ncbi:MAG: Abi family protein, partial [Pseudobutyrivibrio sp.]|nr:Abi family protein [Pseudobutyrivibrio sp.]
MNTLIKVITSIIDKGNYHYIEHAKANHNNVPLWVLLNAVTFGQTVKMYQLQKQSIKYCISKEYPFLNEGTLASVLR